MVERIKNMPTKLLEAWKKLTSKQKVMIISIIAAVVIAMAIFLWAMNRPQMQQLAVCSSTGDASQIVDMLVAEGIDYELSKNGTIISVDKSDYSNALLLIGKSNVKATAGMSYEDAFNNDMSTTESEKQSKILLANQEALRNMIKQIDFIDDAVVFMTKPDTSSSILAETEETSVSVMLEANTDISYDKADAIATLIANAVGNSTNNSIRLIDQKGNLLFNGADDLSTGSVTSALDFRTKLTNTCVNNIISTLLKYGYDDAQVSPHFEFDMNKVNEFYTEYSVANGQEQGYLDGDYTYNSKGTTGTMGVPGTDPNGDDTEYQIQNGGSSDSKVTVEKHKYLPNKREVQTEKAMGTLQTDASSISIVVTSYNIIKEEDLELQGALEGTTFEQYVLDNNIRVKTDIDEDLVTHVAMATGIPEGSIMITAWEQPIFQAKTEATRSVSDYLLIILTVLIIGLLLFVVFRGTAPVEVTEVEPELSIEGILAKTREDQSLDDIAFDDKSEARKMIEKFVDEKPDAVAQLLRNWLNDDWG